MALKNFRHELFDEIVELMVDLSKYKGYEYDQECGSTYCGFCYQPVKDDKCNHKADCSFNNIKIMLKRIDEYKRLEDFAKGRKITSIRKQ